MSKQEIERRFLLSQFPPINHGDARIMDIEQGYFDNLYTGISMRVRIVGKALSFVTIKEGNGLIRDEFEKEVNLDLAVKMMEICHHRLSKIRIKLDRWEVDIYGPPLGGIIMAECEMASVDERIDLPSWVRNCGIEVTNSITNLHLARLATDLRGLNVSSLFHLDQKLRTVPRIVLTGGPCSGKSTALAAIAREFPDVHIVPEVASIIISQVGIIPSSDEISLARFQRVIYRTQRIFEETSVEYAIANGKKAVIFDRGTVDALPYLGGNVDKFETIFQTKRNSEYLRYDAVACLNVPDRDIFELKKNNNPARRENYGEAVLLGEGIKKAWIQHYNFQAMPIRSNWEDCEKDVLDFIRKQVQPA